MRIRKHFLTLQLPLVCLAFFPGSSFAEALFLDRFEYEIGELTQASSSVWTPTITDMVNQDFPVVDGQPAWDFTSQVDGPVTNAYYGTVFASPGIISESLNTFFALEVPEAPIGTETTAGIVPALSIGGNGRLVNLSTRALVETGEAVMIGGFIIEDGARQVLIQALGPELANFGLTNALADPVLTVTNTTDPDNPIELVVNDNWEDSQGQLVSDLWEGGPPLAEGSPSSAAVLTLEPGEYTAKVEGKNGMTGVALVEIFGIDSADAGGRLVNISTRALVGNGGGGHDRGFYHRRWTPTGAYPGAWPRSGE